MAKQDGLIKITGTIDDITFYKMGDQYYARMKSSLTGKRFWKDKAFEGSRRSATALGQASRLASLLYRTLPKEQKGRPVFQELTGKIKFMILDGMDAAAITIWFTDQYQSHILLQTQQENSTPVINKKTFAVLPLTPGFNHCLVKLNSFHPIYLKDISAGKNGELFRNIQRRTLHKQQLE